MATISHLQYDRVMTAPDTLSLASRLCLACGMCCDGTVHAFARIQAADVEPAQAAGFAPYDTPDGLPAFPRPCRYLDGAACRRYMDWRPSICGDYFCKLQKRVATDECAEDEAFQLIANALSARKQVQAVLPSCTTLEHARKRYSELASSRQALAPEDARLVTRLFMLERLLDLHFRQASLVPLPTFPADSGPTSAQ